MICYVPFPRFGKGEIGHAAGFAVAKGFASKVGGFFGCHAFGLPAAARPHPLPVHFDAVVKNNVGFAVVPPRGAFARVHAGESSGVGFCAHIGLLRGAVRCSGGRFSVSPSVSPKSGNLPENLPGYANRRNEPQTITAGIARKFTCSNMGKVFYNAFAQSKGLKSYPEQIECNLLNKYAFLILSSFYKSPENLPNRLDCAEQHKRGGRELGGSPRAPLFFKKPSKASSTLLFFSSVLGSSLFLMVCGDEPSAKSARNFLKYFLEFWKKFRCVTLDARGVMRGEAATLGVQDGKSDIRSFGRSALAGLCLYPSAICTAGDKLRAMDAPASAGLTGARRLEVAA